MYKLSLRKRQSGAVFEHLNDRTSRVCQHFGASVTRTSTVGQYLGASVNDRASSVGQYLSALMTGPLEWDSI